MNYHVLRRRSRGLRQSLLKHVVTLVADTNPVDRAQDDRLADTQPQTFGPNRLRNPSVSGHLRWCLPC